MPRWICFLLPAVMSLLAAGCRTPTDRPAAGELRVHTAFPGGSARVLSIDQHTRTVQIVPTPHPGRGWECWWYFCLEGVRPGETITLDVGQGVWATPDQAHFSHDQRTWQQTAPGRRQAGRIVYQQTVNTSSVWFAWGPPFVLAQAVELVRTTARQHPFAEAFTLTQSREGQAVPALLIREPGPATPSRLGIWVQARQHAWESGSSWVGKGFLDWLVSADPRAQALRRQADIYFVPIMDVDNVERGAGGKNQTPQDHNRDWSDAPHWPEVAAAQRRIRELNAAGRFDLFVDLHNPAAGDREPFYFVTPANELAPAAARNLAAFVAASRAEITGPLALSAKLRESGASYDKDWQKISKNWVSRACAPHVVALTLETSWNTPHSNRAGYETVGRQLGLAMERYFREPRR